MKKILFGIHQIMLAHKYLLGGKEGEFTLLFAREWGMESTGLESTWQGWEVDTLGLESSIYCSALLQGILPASLMSPALIGRFFTTSTTRKAQF